MNLSVKKYTHPIAALIFMLLFSTACKKEDNSMQNPVVNAVDPGSASGGDVITITGSGLAGMESIIFDNGDVPANFNPVFNTATAILFRVPDTAFGGAQNIVLTNSIGKQVSVPITVIALPTISRIYPTDFMEGSTVTISGNNLETVSKVTLSGTGAEATIVSAERKSLVITMPAVSQAKVKLMIENASGTREPDINLVNVDAAFKIFAEGSWAMDNWSWGGTYTNSTDDAVTGTEALKANMVGNSWGALSLHANTPIDLSTYKDIAFWIKGGAEDITFSLMLNWANAVDVVVPAGRWNYYTFPLQPWKSAGVNALNDLIFQVKGDGSLVYFDNILLLK